MLRRYVWNIKCSYIQSDVVCIQQFEDSTPFEALSFHLTPPLPPPTPKRGSTKIPVKNLLEEIVSVGETISRNGVCLPDRPKNKVIAIAGHAAQR